MKSFGLRKLSKKPKDKVFAQRKFNSLLLLVTERPFNSETNKNNNIRIKKVLVRTFKLNICG